MGESNWPENLFQNVKGVEIVMSLLQEEAFWLVSCIEVVFKGFWELAELFFYEYECMY